MVHRPVNQSSHAGGHDDTAENDGHNYPPLATIVGARVQHAITSGGSKHIGPPQYRPVFVTATSAARLAGNLSPR
jgi:hypothetical protein